MRISSILAALALSGTLFASVAGAQSARSVLITEDADYFGFDLRTEKNVTLDQCEDSCVADQGCRAFTYNPKAKWCFLKSDFNEIKDFAGAVAGRISSDTASPISARRRRSPSSLNR